MKIRNLPIGDVHPYKRNPRLNDCAVEKVAASIREFGWRQPIVVDAEMVVIAGHTRLKAAALLGHDKVPVHVADGLTPDQVRAYRLADNRVGEGVEWDRDLLALELGDLSEAGYALELTGFDEDEIGRALAGEVEAGPDDFPEFDESIPTEHTCPKCGYKWSGNA